MNKYYYVPVTSRHIKYDNLSLLDVTGTIDALLKDRELGRVEMLYKDKTDSSSLEMKQVLSHYNSETSLLYKSMGVLERLVLVKNEDGLKELATEHNIVATDNYLSCFEVSACDVVKIFEDSDYFNEAYNYFCLYKYRKAQKDKAKIKK